jgi:hypothetical protein
MTKNTSNKIKTRKILFCIICVTLILVVSFAGIYYLTPPDSQLKATDVVTNFSDGAWSKTKIISYDDTGTTIDGEGYEDSLITSGTYDGKACWILTNNFTFTYTDGTQRVDYVTYYIEKSTYNNLHLSQKQVINGEVRFDEEINPGSEGFDDDLLVYGNMTISAVSETVQVPAGTFNATVRTRIDDPETGIYYSVWMSEDVPAWGIVKSRFYIGNLTVCEYLLESYGS